MNGRDIVLDTQREFATANRRIVDDYANIAFLVKNKHKSDLGNIEDPHGRKGVQLDHAFHLCERDVVAVVNLNLLLHHTLHARRVAADHSLNDPSLYVKQTDNNKCQYVRKRRN